MRLGNSEEGCNSETLDTLFCRVSDNLGWEEYYLEGHFLGSNEEWGNLPFSLLPENKNRDMP